MAANASNDASNEVRILAETALRQAEQYAGISYVGWDPHTSCFGDHGPFWSFNGPPPTLEMVRKEKLNCIGLVNVVCRHLSLDIPGVQDQTYYAGGTYEWFTHLDSQGKLEVFDASKNYPRGTLLIRRFRNQDDDGHFALATGFKSVIHSIRTYGVVRDVLWDNYYEFACLPDNWLMK